MRAAGKRVCSLLLDMRPTCLMRSNAIICIVGFICHLVCIWTHHRRYKACVFKVTLACTFKRQIVWFSSLSLGKHIIQQASLIFITQLTRLQTPHLLVFRHFEWRPDCSPGVEGTTRVSLPMGVGSGWRNLHQASEHAYSSSQTTVVLCVCTCSPYLVFWHVLLMLFSCM